MLAPANRKTHEPLFSFFISVAKFHLSPPSRSVCARQLLFYFCSCFCSCPAQPFRLAWRVWCMLMYLLSQDSCFESQTIHSDKDDTTEWPPKTKKKHPKTIEKTEPNKNMGQGERKEKHLTKSMRCLYACERLCERVFACVCGWYSTLNTIASAEDNNNNHIHLCLSTSIH